LGIPGIATFSSRNCLLSNLEHRQERFLRDLDLADALHALLAFLPALVPLQLNMSKLA